MASSSPSRLTRSGRDIARQQPQPKPSVATPPLPQTPTPPPPDAHLPTRLRALPHRTSLPPCIAVEQQQRARRPKRQKLEQTELPPNEPSQLPQEPVAEIPLPSFTYFEVPILTDTRLRGLPHRTGSPPPIAYKQKRTPTARKEKKEKEEQKEQQQEPLPKQLLPRRICLSTPLSESDLAEEKRRRDATMPVALRRPSSSHETRSNSNEKGHSRPNGTRTNGLVNGHSPSKINNLAHACNATLTNGLPESTHTHPSQHPPPLPAAPPTRTEEKDRERALERNIDRVVFGEVMFKAWYPSWYPKEIIGEKALDGKGMGIVVQTLYVCKRCFGYAKEVHEWVRHCQLCDKGPPGMKIYDHGGEGAVWSVWEIDGDVDTIFCQNLSLFAKLFLDNKSVFFDVSGFNYFLLVHNPTSQIVGFFSKEKMSWDNNNLACILIFPPWQRKGLGSILMGVSYEISRREEILGGPEKPISDLGKKGYKMFWGREIARWLLEARETDRKKGKGMICVKDVSLGTWIHGEDCLGVLREMGLVERAGKGRGEVERVLLDKGKVREWVEKMGLGLERVVDREGFAEGYGYKHVVEEEVGG